MGPATPPARLVLESCPLPGGRAGGRAGGAERGGSGRACAAPRRRLRTRAGGPPPTRRGTTTPSILGGSLRLRLPPPPSLCVASRLPSLEGPGNKGAPRGGCSFRRGGLRWAGWREQLFSLTLALPLPPPEAARVLGTPVDSRWVAQPAASHPALPPQPPDLGLSEKPGPSEALPRRRAPADPPSSCLGAAPGRSLACGLHLGAFVSLGRWCGCAACSAESRLLGSAEGSAAVASGAQG